MAGTPRTCGSWRRLSTAAARPVTPPRGGYPPNLEYLEDHYGIRVDEDWYAVFYSAFADNLMPDITVVVREP